MLVILKGLGIEGEGRLCLVQWYDGERQNDGYISEDYMK